MADTWSSRDEPVLKAIVEMTDEGAERVHSDDLVERTGLDSGVIQRALVALAHEDPPFFTAHESSSMAGSVIGFATHPTGHARRTVGTWPTPETLAERLIVGMLQAADATEDEEEASRLRRTGQWFGSAGRDVLVNLVANAMGGG